MTQQELTRILELHKKWLDDEDDGRRADLRRADLRRADLSDADLRRADLSDANMRRADLSGADLSDADLRRADLRRADLRRADLRRADLSDADLRRANMRRADLSGADLSDANMRRADLSGADLSGADLSDADLRRADLRRANLRRANGLISTINYIDANFEKTSEGYIAYKTFGGHYTPNKNWKIESGEIIEEVVNFSKQSSCGCGINVAPVEWVKDNYGGVIWKVLIRFEWLAGVCVPYRTDGKIRCERVQLLEIVK